ncbi:MAG TPA: imidazolonepropionase [Ilumatobacteraceae bacterium]|nr:imidazolonepropionase [Ilumatobacteraceae bacterium]
MNDLNVVHAASLAQVHDSGEFRRGPTHADLDLVTDGAVASRNGRISAVGVTADVLAAHGDDDVQTIDARGRCVLPGLVECHSHPLFAGERHHEYAERLGGASLAEVAARGGGIWSSVVATRRATDDELLAMLSTRLRRIMEGGVTTLEVKSGYGLTVDEELRGLELLQRARSMTPMQLAITFLGAHVVPRDLDGDAEARGARYTDLIGGDMLTAVVAQAIAEFQDVTVEEGYFTPDQGLQLMRRSHDSGLPVRVHADAWASSRGWRTAVEGGAVSAEHLTYTPDHEISDVGRTDTIAVILPMAELVYMTSRRANARLFIETGVPVAIATDFCSSIRATSLLTTLAVAAPWFRMTPGEVIVAATLNGAYSLGRQSACGSLDVGKRGDLIILDCSHPDEVCLAVGAPLLDQVVIAGRVVVGEQA